MQYNNDIIAVHDTSTQAMTEVALGLSMAFFALLIIALMSLTLPAKVDNISQTSASNKTLAVDTTNQINLSIQDPQKSASKSKTPAKVDDLILLYWGGQFFDTQQQLVNINDVINQQNIVVAVDPQIPFNQLVTIQTQFSGKTLRLTTLDEKWQRALNKETLNSANRSAHLSSVDYGE